MSDAEVENEDLIEEAPAKEALSESTSDDVASIEAKLEKYYDRLPKVISRITLDNKGEAGAALSSLLKTFKVINELERSLLGPDESYDDLSLKRLYEMASSNSGGSDEQITELEEANAAFASENEILSETIQSLSFELDSLKKQAADEIIETGKSKPFKLKDVKKSLVTLDGAVEKLEDNLNFLCASPVVNEDIPLDEKLLKAISEFDDITPDLLKASPDNLTFLGRALRRVGFAYDYKDIATVRKLVVSLVKTNKKLSDFGEMFEPIAEQLAKVHHMVTLLELHAGYDERSGPQYQEAQEEIERLKNKIATLEEVHGTIEQTQEKVEEANQEYNFSLHRRAAVEEEILELRDELKDEVKDYDVCQHMFNSYLDMAEAWIEGKSLNVGKKTLSHEELDQKLRDIESSTGIIYARKFRTEVTSHVNSIASSNKGGRAAIKWESYEKLADVIRNRFSSYTKAMNDFDTLQKRYDKLEKETEDPKSKRGLKKSLNDANSLVKDLQNEVKNFREEQVKLKQGIKALEEGYQDEVEEIKIECKSRIAGLLQRSRQIEDGLLVEKLEHEILALRSYADECKGQKEEIEESFIAYEQRVGIWIENEEDLKRNLAKAQKRASIKNTFMAASLGIGAAAAFGITSLMLGHKMGGYFSFALMATFIPALYIGGMTYHHESKNLLSSKKEKIKKSLKPAFSAAAGGLVTGLIATLPFVIGYQADVDQAAQDYIEANQLDNEITLPMDQIKDKVESFSEFYELVCAGKECISEVNEEGEFLIIRPKKQELKNYGF